MGIRYNDPRLLAAGLLLSVGSLAAVIAGRFVSVTVPQPVEWAHEVTVCPDLEIEDGALSEAMETLIGAGLPLRLGALPCPRSAAIHLSVSVAEVDRVSPPKVGIDGKEARGAFERKVIGELIVDCSAFVVSPNDSEAIAHEIAHCVGYEHARNAPAGHLMNANYDRISLKDLRGMGTKRR